TPCSVIASGAKQSPADRYQRPLFLDHAVMPGLEPGISRRRTPPATDGRVTPTAVLFRFQRPCYIAARVCWLSLAGSPRRRGPILPPHVPRDNGSLPPQGLQEDAELHV